jgi:hypothetical protein
MVNWSLKALLDNVDLRTNLIKEELVEIRENGDERRSLIEYSGGDVSIEVCCWWECDYFSCRLH